MSDINLDFTVSNNNIDFTVQPNDITITPTDIQLSFYTAPAPIPAGTNGQLQYNNNGVLGGANNTSFSAGNLTLAVANTKITGGNNHYYLQTDGTGNLTWAVGTGNISGNGTVAGANTQIQFNDDGANFGGNAGFTFNKINGNVDIPGNLIIVGNLYANNFAGNANNANYSNFAGQVVDNTQSNITSLGILTSLSVTGNSNTGNIYTSGASGNISGANVIFANSFSATGNVNASIVSATGNITANYFLGNGSLLTGITVSSASISNGTSNVNIPTASGNVTITAGGTTSLTVSSANVTARQFISNVATGTAPFVVSSNTVVANLRATAANTISTTGYSGSATLYPLVTSSTGSGTVSAIVSSNFAYRDDIDTLFTNLSGNVANAISIAGGNLTLTGNVQSNNIRFTSSIASNVTPNVAVSTTITDKLPIVLNGVTYYICLTSVV